MSETITLQAIQAAAKELLSATERGGLISTGQISLPIGWQPLPKERYTAYRIKATNPDMGLFAKVFSSDARPYAAALYQAYLELAALDLKTPVLKPTELVESVLFFPLGQPKYQRPLIESVTQKQLEQTAGIITRYGLVPIQPYGEVAVISVGDTEYLTDIVEDTDSNADRFLYPRQSTT